MVHRPGGLTVIDDLTTKRSLDLTSIISDPLVTHFPQNLHWNKEVFLLRRKILTVIDSGGVNGGWVGFKLADMPLTHIALIAGFIRCECFGVTGGIGAGGGLHVAAGIATASTAVFTTDEDNIVTDFILNLSAGVGIDSTIDSATVLTEVNDNTGGGAGIYFNVGVIDSNISANGTVDVDVDLHVLWADISGGV